MATNNSEPAPVLRPYTEMTVAELLETPRRQRGETPCTYDSILIFNNGVEHECSGYRVMCVIGLVGRRSYAAPRHLLTTIADDIAWNMRGDRPEFLMRTECCPGSGALHFHNMHSVVLAGHGYLSTLTLDVEPTISSFSLTSETG